MKKRKYILISSILIFLLNFPIHFMFDIFENDIIAVFFPVNESIFQHMKMIYTCFFIFYFILFIVRRRFKYNNIFLANLISSLSCIGFFLIIYIPIYFRFGENMIFTFILLFIAILFGQYISSYIIQEKQYSYIDFISIILLLILLIVNGYLTYYPIKNFLFWDPEHETYERVLK